MGIYINPKSMSKEQYLHEHGTKIDQELARDFDTERDRSNVLIVLGSYYGQHTYAALCFSNREKARFIDLYDREHEWYLLPTSRIGSEAGLPAEYPDVQ